MATVKKKAQNGAKLDTIGLQFNLNKTNSALDSTAKAKTSGGTKVWSPEEKSKWQKEKSSIGAPPPGFKPKKKTMKCGGKVKAKKK